MIKQAIKFVGISGIGWIIDFIIYNILSLIVNLNISTSNLISSCIGVSFVFIISTRKLFINKSKINLKFKYIIYLFYQLLLIFISSKLIVFLKVIILEFNILNNNDLINILVKLLITPFTLIINYFVMKILIEKI